MCSTCCHWYEPQAFSRDSRSRDGKQPQCNECRDKWEGTERGVYSRMMAYLKKHEPHIEPLWSFDIFHRMWVDANGRCTWCGAGLAEWQSKGHRLDRVSNDDGHEPENTRLSCYPCNIERRRTHLYAFKDRIKGLVAEHGWGRVPWSEISPQYRRNKIRRTSHLRVAPPTLELAGFGKVAL